MKKKKPDQADRIEHILQESLKAQRAILATDKLILAAISKCHENGISIIPGTPRFFNKTHLADHRHVHSHGHGHETNN